MMRRKPIASRAALHLLNIPSKTVQFACLTSGVTRTMRQKCTIIYHTKKNTKIFGEGLNSPTQTPPTLMPQTSKWQHAWSVSALRRENSVYAYDMPAPLSYLVGSWPWPLTSDLEHFVSSVHLHGEYLWQVWLKSLHRATRSTDGRTTINSIPPPPAVGGLI